MGTADLRSRNIGLADDRVKSLAHNLWRFLTLNHTNLGVASNAWGGSDTDAWIGKRLEISCVRTQFAGKAVNGFSVRCELPATMETRPAPRVEVNLDDQIPF